MIMHQDGHITYIGTSAYDYFKLWKGFAGTMRINFASSTQGPSPTLSVYIANTNVTESLTTGLADAVAYDTVLVYTANPDTVLMRIAATQFEYCGSYRINYESTPVSVDDRAVQKADVEVFPNPSTDGVFNLRSAAERMILVDVLDVNGRSVLRMSGVNAAHLTLDLSSVPSGLYATQVRTSAGRTATVRVVTSH
jgi:Secretion system C-terminal sorting domain